MPLYSIKFKHIEESEYEAHIEANSKEEAKNMFNESPFDYVVNEEPSKVQGIDVEIIETVLIK